MAGLESYTQQDLDRIVKMLSEAEGEKQLMSWVTDYVSTHLAVTQGSQIIGVPLLVFQEAPPIATPESTTSATFVDLATRGPELTKMADGNWIVIWGCLMENNAAGDVVGEMGVQPSWAGLSDSQVASAAVAVNLRCNCVYSRAFGAQGPAAVDATGQGNNSIRAQFRRQSGLGTPTFLNRWLVAVRTGPPTPGN
jgi:hypothetical protein